MLTGSGLLYVFPRVLFSGSRIQIPDIATPAKEGYPRHGTDYERYRNAFDLICEQKEDSTV